MSNINLKLIEDISIKEIKELDSFIKAYNGCDGNTPDEKKLNCLNFLKGKIKAEDYDRLLGFAKAYTKNGEIPTDQEWAEFKTVYREIGNGRINTAKQKIEELSKIYTGVANINLDGDVVTPKQLEDKYKLAEDNFKLAGALQTILTLSFSLIGFMLFTIIARLITNLGAMSRIVVVLLTGALSALGMGLLAFLTHLITGRFKAKSLTKLKRVEEVYTGNLDNLNVLKANLKSVEENGKRIETQYDVELFARLDFSNEIEIDESVKKTETLENNDGENTAHEADAQNPQETAENEVAEEQKAEPQTNKNPKETGKKVVKKSTKSDNTATGEQK